CVRPPARGSAAPERRTSTSSGETATAGDTSAAARSPTGPPPAAPLPAKRIAPHASSLLPIRRPVPEIRSFELVDQAVDGDQGPEAHVHRHHGNKHEVRNRDAYDLH